MEYLKADRDTLLLMGYAGIFFFLPVATSPTVICEMFVIVIWIASGKFITDIKALQKSDIRIPIIFFILLPWIGLIYTPAFHEGLNVAFKTLNWLFAIAFMSLLQSKAITATYGNKKPIDNIINMFLAGLALNSTIAILQFTGLVPLKRGQPVGLLGGDAAHIPFSMLLTTGILISSFYFFKARAWKIRLLYVILMVQFLITVSFTGSRTGYAALIVLSPLIVYNIIRRRHLLKIVIGSVMIVSLLFAMPLAQNRMSKIKEDIIQYQQGNVNTSIGQRFYMWEIAFAEIKKNPLLGLGTAGFLTAWEQKKGDPALSFFIHGNPHNSFLYMMVNFGVLGLISFCWLLFIMFKKGWKGRDSSLGFALLVFTIVFIVGSLVDTPLLSISLGKAFSLFAGAAGTIDRS